MSVHRTPQELVGQLNFQPVGQKVAPNFVICPTAVSKVRDRVPIPTICRYCNSVVKLVNNDEVYGQLVGKWPFVYCCQNSECGALVGLHSNTDIPLGTLANKELRALRQKAKNSFLYSVKLKCVTMSAAYKWLASELGKPLSETHYGFMDTEDLQLALKITEATNLIYSESNNV